MIYKVRQSHDIFEDNPGLLAVEKYACLTDKQMKVVVLICDPSRDNPIGTLSGRLRRERACILAGYLLETDGKRLAKNARDIVDGKVASIEAAIEEFKKNHYFERDHDREAIKKQISEIREFLLSDKGNDPKKLKLGQELGVKLPDLEEALLKYDDPVKYEGQTYTSYDLPPDVIEDGEGLSTIDAFHKMNQEKNDTRED